LNEVIQDIPKIVIMHGTPYYPEAFTSPQDIIDKVNELVGDNYLIVNSHRALNQWGWQDNPRARTIIHGLDPAEWFDLPKEPRVVTMISPGGLPAYYDRSFLDFIREALEEEGIIHCHITVDFQARSFNEYRDFLGRSLIYINPTRESPMPRARTEAMLSGCCVLTTPYQDADTFIKNGVNGFIIPRNPKVVADICVELLNDYQRAAEVGQEGKKTAQELFNISRYQQDWKDWLAFVITDYKSKH
jgi:glycosyltransferase involved in cell wall biosynthesis